MILSKHDDGLEVFDLLVKASRKQTKRNRSRFG
jgi:hypothetical protein